MIRSEIKLKFKNFNSAREINEIRYCFIDNNMGISF